MSASSEPDATKFRPDFPSVGSLEEGEYRQGGKWVTKVRFADRVVDLSVKAELSNRSSEGAGEETLEVIPEDDGRVRLKYTCDRVSMSDGDAASDTREWTLSPWNEAGRMVYHSVSNTVTTERTRLAERNAGRRETIGTAVAIVVMLGASVLLFFMIRALMS